MNLSSFRLTGSLMLVVLTAAQGTSTPTAKADRRPTDSVKTSHAQARRMTIVRTGYGRAKPDSATIEVPYQVEGVSLEEVEKKQRDLKQQLETAVKPFDTKSGTVYGSGGQSGQVYRDGKTLTNYTGSFNVYVRDLTRFKLLLGELSKRTTFSLSVRCKVENIAAVQSAMSRAQLNAVAAARRRADVLAKAAGTRIVGIWELNEGEFTVVSPTEIPFRKPAECEIPTEIDVASAQITIVFELAPSEHMQ